MQFEIEEKESVSRRPLKRVFIIPSHPDGLFITRDPEEGTKTVGRIGLAGVRPGVVAMLEDGVVTIEDLFMFAGDSYTFMPRSDDKFKLTAEIEGPGFGPAVQVPIKDFQEMEPVPLRRT